MDTFCHLKRKLLLNFCNTGIHGASLPPCQLRCSWGVEGMNGGGRLDFRKQERWSSLSMTFRLHEGCWMMKWQSAFPCPASPACSITTAPHHQVSRSPTLLMIESSPFAPTTRSHPDWFESSQSLLQERRSLVRIKAWAGDWGRSFDWYYVGAILLLQVSQSCKSGPASAEVHSLSLGSVAAASSLLRCPSFYS